MKVVEVGEIEMAGGRDDEVRRLGQLCLEAYGRAAYDAAGMRLSLDRATIQRAVDAYPSLNQALQLAEECGELVVAVPHRREARETAFASLTARPLRNDTAENPRWAACTRELGREPSQNEFGQWCLRRWDDYFAAVGLVDLCGSARASACRAHGRAFEAWLASR